MAIMSAAKPTGSAWKLPPETIWPSDRTSGLSVAALASISSVRAGHGAAHPSPRRHLRLAADAIGVLHPGIALAVAFADLAALSRARIVAAASIWPGWPRKRVDFGFQGRGRAHDRIGGQRRDHQRLARGLPGLEQAGQRIGGGELGAVDQRQAFLRAKRDRGKPFHGKRFRAGHHLRPSTIASPWPIITAVMWASGPGRPRPRPSPGPGSPG
jgi:hypothetical protein